MTEIQPRTQEYFPKLKAWCGLNLFLADVRRRKIGIKMASCTHDVEICVMAVKAVVDTKGSNVKVKLRTVIKIMIRTGDLVVGFSSLK